MDSGTLTESLAETLALFGSSGEPRTTTEIAEELDLGRRSTYDRLQRLVEQDRLQTKKVGANARVWWRTRAGTGGGAAPDWPRAAESLIDDVLDDVAVGVFVLDEDFDVAWINETTERYFDLDRASVLGRDKRELVAERIAPRVENADAFTETVFATYDDNTDAERFECHLESDGENGDRWLEHRSKPIECGEYAGGRVELYYDVTDRKEARLEGDGSGAGFESLVEAVEEYAIFTLDADGYVRTWNAGAERIKGYAEDDIVGEHVSTFYTEGERAAGVPERNLEAATREGSIEDEGWRRRADGSTFWANVTITAIYDDAGDLEGFAKVTRDMTERREREEQLRRERRLTEKLLETAPVRLTVYDADGTIERMNSRARKQLEVEEPTDDAVGAVKTFDEDGNRLSGDDRPVPQVIDTGEPVSGMVVQHETPAGDRRWASLTASPLFDADGDLDRIVVAGSDITDLKRKERRLRRQRDDLEAELDDVFDRINDAVYGLDEDWQFTYCNQRAEELLDASAEELLGVSVWDAFPNARDGAYREQFERAMATQEPVVFEEYSETAGAHIEVTAYPSENGLSVYFRDVSERKRTEAALRKSERRYRRLFESIDEGLCTIEVLFDGDEAIDYRFLETNPAFEDQTGLADAEGERMRELAPDHEDHWFEIYGRVATEREPERFTAQATALDRWYDVYAFPIGDPEDRQVAVLFDDVTQRKERERELLQYRTIVETMQDGVYVLDGEGYYTLVNDAYAAMFGRPRDDIEGRHVEEILDDESVVEKSRELKDSLARGERTAATLEAELTDADGEEWIGEATFALIGDGGECGRVGVVRDVTERKERENQLAAQRERLRERERAMREAYRIIGDTEKSFPEQIDALLGVVRETLDTEYATFSNVQGEDYVFLAVDAPADADIAAGDVAGLSTTICERVVEGNETLVLDDVAIDAPELTGRAAHTEWGISSYIGAPVVDGDGPYGTFCFYDTDARETPFSEWEIAFVELLSNWVSNELERQEYTERLDALNNLNGVVRRTIEAIIDQSTREEIEQTVCDRLAAAPSYSFAWTGTVDANSQEVIARAEAGDEGYLDDITITVDPDDERSEGPTGRALRTGEMQVSQDLATDDRHDPWRERVDEYAFRSSAAIPIVHEGTVYGVLNVYADRPRAFSGEEGEVIAQLGEIVGHAIAATERKRALLSDELVELAFEIENVFETVGVAPPADGDVALEHAVPLGDDEFLVYGTASTPAATETVDALVERVAHWESVRYHDDDDPTQFEVRMVDPPVLSVLASLGGYVEEAVIADGDYRMRLHLAPSVDVRRVTAAVDDAYPTAELLRRRQIERPRTDRQRNPRELVGDLTDRQRTSLEAAFHAGFFEWPRDTSGEEVAESIGVAAPTFHQHLRKAERKVFEAILATEATADGATTGRSAD